MNEWMNEWMNQQTNEPIEWKYYLLNQGMLIEDRLQWSLIPNTSPPIINDVQVQDLDLSTIFIENGLDLDLTWIF